MLARFAVSAGLALALVPVGCGEDGPRTATAGHRGGGAGGADAGIGGGRGHEGLGVLREEVLRSLETFRAWSAMHADTYVYIRHAQSFTGEFCSTTVTVEDGNVTGRHGFTGHGDQIATTSDGDASAGEPCHPASTMEALYQECLTDVLCQSPTENRIFVEVDARGLLVRCGYIPDGCFDDCYVGLAPLRLEADASPWNVQRDGCCPIDAEPDCCMHYGGKVGACGPYCDGMPWPGPGWYPFIDEDHCWSWIEPTGTTDCCGCAPGDP